MENEREIASATLLIMFLTGGGYLLGLLTQITIAHYFGTGSKLDAFIAASVIPEFIFGITNVVFSTSFVILFPIYLKTKGEKEGKIFVKKLFTILVIFLVILITIIVLASPFIATVIAPGFSEELLNQTSVLIKILSIGAFFFGLSSFSTALLYHEHQFLAAKILRSIVSVGIIGGILLLEQSLQVKSIAIGTIVGIVVGIIIQYNVLRRTEYCFSFTRDITDEYFTKLFILSWPLVATAVFYYTNKLLINMIASSLAVGSISILNYAFLIVNVPIILFSESIAAVLFPHLTKKAANNQIMEIKNTISRAIKAVLFIMVPITVILLIFHYETIKFLFERGAFTSASTTAVSNALVFFGVGLIPLSLMSLISTGMNVLQKMKKRMYLFLLSLVLNVSLSLVLVRVLSFQGIALGITLSSWGVASLGLYTLSKELGGFDCKSIMKEMLKIGVAAAIMTLLLLGGKLFILAKAETIASKFLELLIVGAVIFVGGVVYLCSMKQMKAEGIGVFLKIIKWYS